MNFKTDKIIGLLLLSGSFLLLIPYILLVVKFDYPIILRRETGYILTEFHKGGSSLIFIWLAFAWTGLPLLEAIVLIGQKLNHQFYFIKWATLLGIMGILVQIIALLRWVFVVPVLAADYVKSNEAVQLTAVSSFKLIHQFGGVLLGEHLGQVFTIVWTIMICSAFLQLNMFPKWLPLFGIVASLIYLLAQTESIATVMPDFPQVELAGLLESTLWLLFLMLMGINLLFSKPR